MKKLTLSQMRTLKKHSEHHSKKHITFNSGSAVATSNDSYDEANGLDVGFYVSGSHGALYGIDRPHAGVAVFGGDVVISGSLGGGSPLKIGTNNTAQILLLSGGAGSSPDESNYLDTNFFFLIVVLLKYLMKDKYPIQMP